MTLSFKNLPVKKQHSMMVMLIAFVATLAYLFNDATSDIFVYQYQLISHGELWRTFTGHFFHTNGIHLLLNLAALALLWALHGHFYDIKSYSLLFIISALICSAGLYFSPLKLVNMLDFPAFYTVFSFLAPSWIFDIRIKQVTYYLLGFG